MNAAQRARVEYNRRRRLLRQRHPHIKRDKWAYSWTRYQLVGECDSPHEVVMRGYYEGLARFERDMSPREREARDNEFEAYAEKMGF